MEVIHDSRTDILSLILKDGLVEESDETKPGILLVYDAKGDLVSVERPETSKRITKPQGIEFQMGKG